MRELFALVICMVLCAGCSSFSPPVPTPSSTPIPVYDPNFSLRMDRKDYMSQTPNYNLTIDANGNVSYEGIKWVAQKGIRTSKISRQQIVDLISVIEQGNVFAMQNHYSEGYDIPTIIFSINLQGKSKRIVYEMSSSNCDFYEENDKQILCRLVHKIEATVNLTQWTK